MDRPRGLRDDLRRLASLPLPDLLAVAWRLLRPAAWVPTFFGVYLGYAFAAKKLVPGQALWTAFWRHGLTDGFTFPLLSSTLSAWWALPAARDLVYALVTLGPLIWGGTLLYNDVHDLEADRTKELRETSPLVQGRITKSTAMAVVYLVSTLGMLLSWLVNPTFFLLMAVALFLSWAYSGPPLRLKGRPGFDVAVNVVGVGLLCVAGGWSITRPIEAFPPSLLVLMALYLSAGYIPTTIADHHVDRRFGVRTTAVALGPDRAFRLGMALLLLGDLAFGAYVLVEAPVPWRFLLVAAPLLVAKDGAYWAGIGEVDELASIWTGLAIFSALVAAVIVCFLLVYTGLWAL